LSQTNAVHRGFRTHTTLGLFVIPLRQNLQLLKSALAFFGTLNGIEEHCTHHAAGNLVHVFEMVREASNVARKKRCAENIDSA
jgi:hypothetical protein